MHKLQTVKDRVIARVKMNEKDSYTFSNGQKIALQRNTENFDKTYTTISQGTVIASDYIPEGATIYFHHNASHDVNRIFNYNSLNAQEIADEIYYFSIPENDCFLWREGNGPIQPLKGFAMALRVFVPYSGVLQGIEPKIMKDTLFIITGEYAGQVVRTLPYSSYEMIIQEVNGREGRYIRCRDMEDPTTKRECEIIAIDNKATDMVNKGLWLVGLNSFDCKPLKEIYAT